MYLGFPLAVVSLSPHWTRCEGTFSSWISASNTSASSGDKLVSAQLSDTSESPLGLTLSKICSAKRISCTTPIQFGYFSAKYIDSVAKTLVSWSTGSQFWIK